MANVAVDEDEEVDYENNVVYEPELEGLFNGMRNILNRLQLFDVAAEDDDDDQGMRWDWDAPPPPAIGRGHHHHHHHRHGLEMFGMVGGDHFRGKIECAFMSHFSLTNYSARTPNTSSYIASSRRR